MARFFAAALFAAALLGFCCVGTRSAAAAECYPHCDYVHFYGPYDFTYIRPGLFGYPLCGPRGECSPYLAYAPSRFRNGRITVRFPRTARPRP